MTTSKLATGPHGWYPPDDCSLDDFRAVVEQTTDPADYPYADAVEQDVLVYGRGCATRRVAESRGARSRPSWPGPCSTGPGIVVFHGAFRTPSVVDRATRRSSTR